MLDDFLPIPDAESLPFYPPESKLVVCVLRRLAQRLASVKVEESCLTLTAEFVEYFLKVYAEGRSSFTGPRMNNLNLVFPYLIRNIVGLRWHKSTVLSSQQLQATHFAVWNWWWVQVRAS